MKYHRSQQVFSRLQKLPDNKLIFLIKRGSRLSFDVLIMRYAKWLKAKLHSIVFNRELAQEIYQLFLIGLWNAFRKGAYTDKGAFQPWMRSVLMNFIRQVLRRKKITIEYDEAEEVFKLAVEDESFQKYEWLNDLASLEYGLREDYRDEFNMRAIGQLSYKEIAEITHQSVAKVKSDIHRGKQFLQKQLSRYFLNRRTKKHIPVQLTVEEKEHVRKSISVNDDQDQHIWKQHAGSSVTR
jgi:RNA polymerase sigma factor (sigma-70 family)